MKFARLSWLLLTAFAVGCQDAAPSAPQSQTPAEEKDTAEPKFDLSEPPVPSDGTEKSAGITGDEPATEPAEETNSAVDSSASTTPK